MPSFRGEQWIGASLRSVETEWTEGIEILLIDSSPTRDTVNIAREFANRLPLRIFERPDLDSWQKKTNFGVQAACSAHLCWLGVDDLWLQGRAAGARAWIEAAPEAPLHLAPSAIIDAHGKSVGVWRCPLPADRDLRWPFVTERLLVQNFIAAPAPVFRRDAWLASGGLDESLWYTADWDMWLKLTAEGLVRYHDQMTTALRIHGGSLTSTGSRNAADFGLQLEMVLDRHLRRFPGYSQEVERAARASIAVNKALASASAGDPRALPGAVSAILRLGPAGMRRYFRDSRIMERVTPRVRAKFGGVF
jgi:glycosyltransferase involved in cell wall biosynthesis